MRFIIIMILTYIGFKFLKGLFAPKETNYQQMSGQRAQSASGEDLVEDPYCHTYIPLSNALSTSMQGKAVYFCSKKCLEAFTALQDKKS